jgi:hypothetical protein
MGECLRGLGEGWTGKESNKSEYLSTLKMAERNAWKNVKNRDWEEKEREKEC